MCRDQWTLTRYLDLALGASVEEVRQAYRRAAAKYHPDAGGDVWFFSKFNKLTTSSVGSTNKPNASEPLRHRFGVFQATCKFVRSIRNFTKQRHIPERDKPAVKLPVSQRQDNRLPVDRRKLRPQ